MGSAKFFFLSAPIPTLFGSGAASTSMNEGLWRPADDSGQPSTSGERHSSSRQVSPEFSRSVTSARDQRSAWRPRLAKEPPSSPRSTRRSPTRAQTDVCIRMPTVALSRSILWIFFSRRTDARLVSPLLGPRSAGANAVAESPSLSLRRRAPRNDDDRCKSQDLFVVLILRELSPAVSCAKA
jgi:hypothetical protein